MQHVHCNTDDEWFLRCYPELTSTVLSFKQSPAKQSPAKQSPAKHVKASVVNWTVVCIPSHCYGKENEWFHNLLAPRNLLHTFSELVVCVCVCVCVSVCVSLCVFVCACVCEILSANLTGSAQCSHMPHDSFCSCATLLLAPCSLLFAPCTLLLALCSLLFAPCTLLLALCSL